MKSYRLMIYPDRARQYRWTLTHANGCIVADSGESYTRSADAWRAVRRLPFKWSDIEVVR